MNGDTEVRTVGYKSIEKINHAIHWFDEFLMSISAWLLPIAFILAVADIGTNDLFFQQNKILLGGWAVAIAIGLEASLRTLVRRAKIAWKEGDWKAFGLWLVLSALIFVVSCVALIIFTTEKMLNYTEEQALASTGISPFWYAVGRAILTGTLVVIQGIAAHETKVAPPDTAAILAQIRHEKTLLPEQIELDALRAQRKMQGDTLFAKRGVNMAKSAINEIRGKEQEMALVPASYERVVDADDNTDGDDDPTPPDGPTGGPRSPRRRGRQSSTMVVVPQGVGDIQYTRSTTGKLANARVNAAKEIIAGTKSEITLQELADAINAKVNEGTPLKAANAYGPRNFAIMELAMEGRLPQWAEKFVAPAA